MEEGVGELCIVMVTKWFNEGVGSCVSVNGGQCIRGLFDGGGWKVVRWGKAPSASMHGWDSDRCNLLMRSVVRQVTAQEEHGAWHVTCGGVLVTL
jgi:hypothetical protein